MSERIVVLCPLEIERRRALRVLGGEPNVRSVRAGPGADAVRRAVESLEIDNVELVVLFGVAGGLRDGVTAPRIVEVRNEAGDALRAPVSLWMRAGAGEGVGGGVGGGGVAVLCVGKPVCSVNEKRLLAESSGAALVDCESFAFARACAARGLPWAVVRGVSDGAGDALPSQAAGWVGAEGRTRVGRVLLSALAKPRLIGEIAGLGRRTKRALRDAGAALAALCEQFCAHDANVPVDSKGVLIVGGSFDPPQRAHVEMARRAADALGLGSILFVPAAVSPLKGKAPTAGDLDRFRMLEIALRDERRAAVCTIELARGGASYTIETLRYLRERLGEKPPLRLLIGADQAAKLHEWREADEILRLAAPAVLLRAPLGKASALMEAMSPHWPPDELERWRQRVVDAPLMEASSTRVRELLAGGADREALVELLDECVLEYIKKGGLYRCSAGRGDGGGEISAPSARSRNR